MTGDRGATTASRIRSSIALLLITLAVASITSGVERLLFGATRSDSSIIVATVATPSGLEDLHPEGPASEPPAEAPQSTPTPHPYHIDPAPRRGSLREIALLALIPTAAMLAGSLLAFVVTFSNWFLHSMQHLAAGVLLSAIATEFLSPIVHASVDFEHRAAVAVGFLLGVVVMLFVEGLGDDDDVADQTDRKRSLFFNSRLRGVSRVDSEVSQINALSKNSSEEEFKRPRYGSLNERASPVAVDIDIRSTIMKTNPRVPWSRVVAIEIDSFLDGFLLGLTASVGAQSATAVMAFAISVEMCFVGVAYGGSFKRIPWKNSLVLLVLAPATLYFGALGGYLLSSAIRSHPLVHIGLLSFGSSALLYLVCEDLLIEAHNAGEMKVRDVLKELKGGAELERCIVKIHSAVSTEDRRYEDVWFFIGFLIAMLYN